LTRFHTTHHIYKFALRKKVFENIFFLREISSAAPTVKLCISSVNDLSRGCFMAEHIVTMEVSMLQSLGWHVHPPTPLAFCRDFMKLVSGGIEPGVDNLSYQLS
jgi:hypothetical protein